METVINRGVNLGWLGNQYAYPFSFPVGHGNGVVTQDQIIPVTWGDIAIYPPYIFPVIVLPIIAVMLVYKGLN